MANQHFRGHGQKAIKTEDRKYQKNTQNYLRKSPKAVKNQH